MKTSLNYSADIVPRIIGMGVLEGHSNLVIIVPGNIDTEQKRNDSSYKAEITNKCHSVERMDPGMQTNVRTS